MNSTITHVPPGFRFHPTDEELVDYYLRRKVASMRIDLDVIKDVDLYKIEPWDLQGSEEENEWYFFSHKDKKYPTGTRTNRATTAGFWKATGRDKAIYSKHELVGMRKTLVFYKGRAPNGQKSDWIMHEYRLETEENGIPQEEGWAVCRVFKKRIAAMRKAGEQDSPIWYGDHSSFIPGIDSPRHHHPSPHYAYTHTSTNWTSCMRPEIEIPNHGIPIDHFPQLPNLESPNFPHGMSSFPVPSFAAMQDLGLARDAHQTLADRNFQPAFRSGSEGSGDQVTDWRVLDKFVASQLSRDDETAKENGDFCMSSEAGLVAEKMVVENGASSSSSCRMDLWK